MSVEIEILCECGRGVSAGLNHRGEIVVEPCSSCQEDEFSKGSEIGYDKGYDEGHDDGYKEGAEEAEGKPEDT